MNKYVSLKKYIETITKFWIKNIFEMPKLKKNNNQIQVFENKFWITFSCENLYWTNFKLLNKKYFWNVKIEKKITIIFKCLKKIFGSNSAVKNMIVSNLSLEIFFLSISKFWRVIFNGFHCLKNGKITNESSDTNVPRWKSHLPHVQISYCHLQVSWFQI